MKSFYKTGDDSGSIDIDKAACVVYSGGVFVCKHINTSLRRPGEWAVTGLQRGGNLAASR